MSQDPSYLRLECMGLGLGFGVSGPWSCAADRRVSDTSKREGVRGFKRFASLPIKTGVWDIL